jgi:hypothetical protein
VGRLDVRPYVLPAISPTSHLATEPAPAQPLDPAGRFVRDGQTFLTPAISLPATSWASPYTMRVLSA